MSKKTIFFKTHVQITILIVATLLCYSNTLNSSFHFDDFHNIVNNPAIRDISDLRSIYKFQPTRFLTYLTLAINYHFGQDDVIGYHLFNIFLHITTSILVFVYIRQLSDTPLGKKSFSSRQSMFPFVVALLFAIHPLKTQAVTYIIQRATVLASLFYLLSLSVFLKWRSTYHPKWFLVLLLTSICAYYSKEISATLPFAIMLTELIFFGSPNGPKHHFVLSSTVLILVPVLVFTSLKSYHRGFEAYQKTIALRNEDSEISHKNELNRTKYIITQTRVIVKYLKLIFVPTGQNIDHDFPISQSILEPRALFSITFLIALFLLAIALHRKNIFAAFGIYFFFLALLVESTLVPIIDVIFESRAYLPSLGITLAIVALFYQHIFPLAAKHKAVTSVNVLFASVALLLGTATYFRNYVWYDEISLWRDAVSKSPHKARTNLELAVAYSLADNLDLAILGYKKVLTLSPRYAKGHNNLAVLYMSRGHYAEAKSHFKEAIHLDPNYLSARYNLAELCINDKDYAKATKLLKDTLSHDPWPSRSYALLGKISYLEKHTSQAIFYLKKAIELNPNDSESFDLLLQISR